MSFLVLALVVGLIVWLLGQGAFGDSPGWIAAKRIWLVSWLFGTLLLMGNIINDILRGSGDMSMVKLAGAILLISPLLGLVAGTVLSPLVAVAVLAFEEVVPATRPDRLILAILAGAGVAAGAGMAAGWALGLFVDPLESLNPFAFLIAPTSLLAILFVSGAASGAAYGLLAKGDGKAAPRTLPEVEE